MATADAVAALSALADKWRDDLVSNVLPFWLKNSLDVECGGYFTCLDRDGTVLAQDKYHWCVARTQNMRGEAACVPCELACLPR